MGLSWNYTHPSQIMDEIAALTPTFAGVNYDALEVMVPCNGGERGCAQGHADHASRWLCTRQGQVRRHGLCADRREDRAALSAPSDDGTHSQPLQCRRADAGTDNVAWHPEDLLEVHPSDAENRGINDGDWVLLRSRAGETTLRAKSPSA